MLIKFTGQNKSTWSSYLDTCVFAYNTSQQDSTKFTPFELMFGRKATLPIDINIQKKSKKLISGINFEDIERLNKEREKRLQAAKTNIVTAQRKQKEHYDKKRAKPLCYKVRALVLVKDFKRKKRKGGKLDPRWIGPYVIQKRLTRGVYVVALCKDPSKTRRVTGAHLKLYKNPSKVNENLT